MMDLPIMKFIFFIISISVSCQSNQELECSMSRTCKNRGSIVMAFGDQNCYCDPLCTAYDDCCEDATALDSAGTVPKLDDGIAKCMFSTEYKFGDPMDRLYIVNKCPVAYKQDNNTKNLCESNSGANIFLQVPVNGLRTNLMYKNFFCAVCNGLDRVETTEDVLFWKAKKTCLIAMSQDDNATDVVQVFNDTSHHNCYHKFIAPPPAQDGSERFRRCAKYIKHCPESWENNPTIVEHCENHTDIVYSHTGVHVFKNKYCALCNGKSNTTCRDPRYKGLGGLNSPFDIPPYSVLMDFNMGKADVRRYANGAPSIQNLDLPSHSCSEHEVHDPFAKVCRPIIPASQKIMRYQQYVEIDSHETNKSCDMIRYGPDEYELLANNDVFVPSLNLTFATMDYRVENGELYICKPPMMAQNYTDKSNVTWVGALNIHDQVRSIATLVCLIISLICLFICIVAHLVFPPLRNVPGKCVLGLSVSLFVGQLLFLATMKLTNYAACYSFALIMHYAFLASFCWTNCLSFDICRAFSVTRSGRGNETKQYIRYSLYAWLVPIVVVIAAVILDVVPGVSDQYKPHYAEPLCWMNRGKAILVTFGAPIALILFSNLILFSLTVRGICISKRIARSVVRRRDKGSARVLDLVLYTKLWVIMGLTWIFSFVAGFSENNVLSYLFDIFNSLQGALLFFAFVLTKKVLKLAKDQRSSIMSSSLFNSFKLSNSATHSSEIQSKSSQKHTSSDSELSAFNELDKKDDHQII